jgi:hypothetical protein
VALVGGVGAALAVALFTVGDVLDQALSFGPAADLPAGPVTVWTSSDEPPSRVRLLAPDGTELALTPEPDPRTVTADGNRWTSAYTATATTPGPHRVETTDGEAALRTTPRLDTDAVRNRLLTWPLALAVTGISVCLMVCIAVPVLRAANRHRAG